MSLDLPFIQMVALRTTMDSILISIVEQMMDHTMMSIGTTIREDTKTEETTEEEDIEIHFSPILKLMMMIMRMTMTMTFTKNS